jgi:hypothetical protein
MAVQPGVAGVDAPAVLEKPRIWATAKADYAAGTGGHRAEIRRIGRDRVSGGSERTTGGGMKRVIIAIGLALAVTGCQPEAKVSDQVHRRAEKRVVELTAEVDQAKAVQRSLERTLVMAGCAVAVLATVLIRNRRGG